jgi:hypothetical protein
MTSCTLDPPTLARLSSASLASLSRRDDAISSAVQSALAAVELAPRVVERRRESRYPYPYPVHLTPLDDHGEPEVQRTFVVIGKHLARHGIDFYCGQPIADRRVIASLDCGANGWIGLVLELGWCRFNRHGWYDNGGRFIAIVPSPLLQLDNRPRAA